MNQPVDYLLSPQQIQRIREEAKRALKKADAIDCFPTPVEAIMEAANLEEIKDQVLDQSFIRKMRRSVSDALHRAVSKVIGLCHVVGRFIVIDQSIHAAKQVFVRLHEVAHSVLPWQRKMYALVETSEKSITPEVSELFDREAQVFPADVLFQVGGFSREAATMDFCLNTPVQLSEKYGASIHSSIWEFASRNCRPCVVIVTDRPALCHGDGFKARLIQAIPSPSFRAQFGEFTWPRMFTPDDDIGSLLSVRAFEASGKRTISLTDLNGDRFECVAESYSNSYNVFVLIYPARALKGPLRIALP